MRQAQIHQTQPWAPGLRWTTRTTTLSNGHTIRCSTHARAHTYKRIVHSRPHERMHAQVHTACTRIRALTKVLLHTHTRGHAHTRRDAHVHACPRACTCMQVIHVRAMSTPQAGMDYMNFGERMVPEKHSAIIATHEVRTPQRHRSCLFNIAVSSDLQLLFNVAMSANLYLECVRTTAHMRL